MNTLRRSAIAMIGVSLMALVAPMRAVAEGKQATVTVHVVQASKKPGETDERLKKFKKQFSDFAYKSYKLVGTEQATVPEGGTKSVQLAGGRKLDVNFRSIGKDGRARLKLSIPGVVDTTVALAEGGDVVLGGPALPSGDGVLFVPVTLNQVK